MDKFSLSVSVDATGFEFRKIESAKENGTDNGKRASKVEFNFLETKKKRKGNSENALAVDDIECSRAEKRKFQDPSNTKCPKHSINQNVNVQYPPTTFDEKKKRDVLRRVAGASQGTDEFALLVERVISEELLMVEDAIKGRDDLQDTILEVSAAFLHKVHKIVDRVRAADLRARRGGVVLQHNEKNVDNKKLLRSLECLRGDYMLELQKWEAVEKARLGNAEQNEEIGTVNSSEEVVKAAKASDEKLVAADAEVSRKVRKVVAASVGRALSKADEVRENVEELRVAVESVHAEQRSLAKKFEVTLFGQQVGFGKPKSMLQSLAAPKRRMQNEAPRNLIRALTQDGGTPEKELRATHNGAENGGTARGLIRALAAETPSID